MPTTSSNMNLPIPTVGVDSGPDWATLIDSCFTLIDQHDHTSGSGVPVTPGGLNINSDLSIGGNNLTSIRSVRMSSNSAVLALGTDLDCIYVVGVDLYYNDGNGNNVRITQSGGVAGSPGSISNLVAPASAAYSAGAGKFIWQQAANTSADMDFGSAIMRNDTASSNALTLQPPAAMGSNYSITLPSLPASQKFMTLDASGVMSAPWAVDNSTLQVSSNTVQVKDLGITKAKLAALGQQVSSSSGAYTVTGNTSGFVSVTNLSITITTSGRPVMLMLLADGTANTCVFATGGSSTQRFTRGGSNLALYRVDAAGNDLPSSMFLHVDAVAAGTYTYAFQVSQTSGTTAVEYTVLMAYEL